MCVWTDGIKNITRNIAKRYKSYKDEGRDYMIDDDMLHSVAEGAYISLGGTVETMKEGSKPYYDYLKYGNRPQQEEPIMIEDNNYNYETPYSFEYEPYFSNNNYSITFDHEVDTSDSIQMIEELYNEDNNIEKEVDSNDVINIVAIIANRLKNTTKKKIIHYISNYRPIMNVHSKEIKAVLIE